MMTNANAPMPDEVGTVLVERVRLRNYRSVKECDVALGPVTFLVGANGAGKSNFIDSLRLIADALTTSLDHALRERGGINEVRRRSSGHPTHFGVRLDVRLPGIQRAHFAFEVGARARGEFVVKREECGVNGARYVVQEGQITCPADKPYPPATADRLYLVHAGGLPEFRPLFDALSRMGFYNLNPDAMRAHQPPDPGEVLARDGGNLASVVERLEHANGTQTKARIEAFLQRVVPELVGFEAQQVGHMETLQFRQRVEGADNPWRFPAINMSDGTLRALGILVALFQTAASGKTRLVGLEEPETALHPAAAGVLRDCIIEASKHVQVVITSHSADLLDDASISPAMIRAVTAAEGRTEIGRLDETTRSVLRERLFTPGELLRTNQLTAEPVDRGTQLRLFEDDY